MMRRILEINLIIVFSVASPMLVAEQDRNVGRDFGLTETGADVEHRPEQGTELVQNADGEPIAVRLRPGVERRIVFPVPVTVGIRNADSQHLKIQNVDRTLFMVATGVIDHVRVLVRHLDKSKTYVLDVSTREPPAQHTALVIDPAPVQTEKAARVQSVPRMRMKKKTDQTIYSHYVRLTRYAAQRLYGPRRLMQEDAAFFRVNELDTVTPVAIVRGGRVLAIPIASWSDGRYQVTALRLENQSDGAVNLDPRTLRGRWLAATFHSNSLGARGDENDVTALYVVSQTGFVNALGAVR